MKKIFTLVILLAFLSVHSQSIVPTPADSASVTTLVTDEFTPVDVHIHIVNHYGTGTSFTWMMKDYTVPSAVWELKLCDNNNCYDLLLGNPVHESLLVANNDTMDFKFQYSPHCINGTGNTHVLVWATGDSAATVIKLTFNANLTTTCVNAVPNISETAVHVFPNPSENFLSIEGLPTNATIQITDLNGRLLYSASELNSNTHNVGTSNLASGMYLLKVSDLQGKFLFAKKFIRQ